MLKSMSSSSISRLNSLSVLGNATSRCTSGTCCSFTVYALGLLRSLGCPDPSWVCSTRVSSDKLRASITLGVISGCPDLSEAQCYSWKPFFIDLMVTGRSPLTTITPFVSSGCPNRSRIGFGIGWVGWENVAFWTSPPDCRTTLPSGCWSTVEPNGNFPLVQSWSCRNEIFGSGRGESMISHIRLLQSSISQVLEDNKLEVFPEGWLHSIESDRMSILFKSQN